MRVAWSKSYLAKNWAPCSSVPMCTNTKRVPLASISLRFSVRSPNASRQNIQPWWRRNTKRTGDSRLSSSRVTPALVRVRMARPRISEDTQRFRPSAASCAARRTVTKIGIQTKSLAIAKTRARCGSAPREIKASVPAKAPDFATSASATMPQCRAGSLAAINSAAPPSATAPATANHIKGGWTGPSPSQAWIFEPCSTAAAAHSKL